MFTVICTGDRNWKGEQDFAIVAGALLKLKDVHGLELLVVEGGAAGADAIARTVCDNEGIDHITCWANWRGRHTRQDEQLVYWAGPYRNKLMLELFKPQLVVAFHRYIARSKGSKHMLTIAADANIRTRLLP